MATPLALVWDLIANDQASPAFAKVGAAADGAAAKTAAAGDSLKKFGVAVGAAAAIVAVESVKSAIKFQSSMLLIQTQAGATAAEVKTMSAAILNLAGQVATAPEALATSLYHVESVGLRAGKALDVVKIAAEGAKVGHADLEETTNALTSAVVSGITGVQNMSQAMGALNSIVGTGDMKLSDLNDALGTGILKVAKEFGLSLTDVGAALADFGDNNIRGANAATMLRVAIQAMAKPVAGGQKVLDGIGISAGQLAKDMQQGGLNKALVDLKTHLTDAGITGVKVGAFLTNAFGKKASVGIPIMVDDLTRIQGKMKAIQDGAGNFGAAWDATKQTTSFALDQIRASVEALGIKIGNALLPTVDAIVKDLAGFFTTISSNKAVMDTFIALIGVATVGALTAFIAKMVIATATVVASGLKMLASMVLTSAGMVTGLTGISTAWIRTGTAAEGAALKGMAVRDTMGKVFGAIASAATTMATYVGTAFKNAGSSITGIGAGVRDAETLGGKLGAIGTGAAGVATALGPMALGIAGGLAAVSLGIAAWDNYKKKQQEARQSVLDLTQAIEQDNGMLGENTRITVINSLNKTSAYDDARKLGISLTEVTDAAMGNATAIADINAKTLQYQITAYGSTRETHGLSAAANDLAQQLGTTGGQLGKAVQKAKDYSDAMGNPTKPASAAGATAAVAAVVKASGPTLDIHAAKLDTVKNAAGGYSLKLDGISQVLKNLPPKVTTDVAITGLTGAMLGLGGILTQVRQLQGASINLQVSAGASSLGSISSNVSPAAAPSGGGGRPKFAAGGVLPNGWSTVGEAGWEAVFTAGGRSQVFSNAVSRSLMPTVAYDSGGLLMPGVTPAINMTGHPEAVLTKDQWNILAAKNARSGPLVHVEHVDSAVDLELWAQQAAFRESMGHFG